MKELQETLETMFWVDADSKRKVESLTKPLSLALLIAVEALEDIEMSDTRNGRHASSTLDRIKQL